MAKLRLNRHYFGRLRLVFHSLGLSSLGGAVFLQVLVFKDITTQGFFMGVETNPTILNLEVALTVFSVIYLLHLFISKLSSLQ